MLIILSGLMVVVNLFRMLFRLLMGCLLLCGFGWIRVLMVFVIILNWLIFLGYGWCGWCMMWFWKYLVNVLMLILVWLFFVSCVMLLVFFIGFNGMLVWLCLSYMSIWWSVVLSNWCFILIFWYWCYCWFDCIVVSVVLLSVGIWWCGVLSWVLFIVSWLIWWSNGVVCRSSFCWLLVEILRWWNLMKIFCKWWSMLCCLLVVWVWVLIGWLCWLLGVVFVKYCFFCW